MTAEADIKFPDFFVEETDAFLKDALASLVIENPSDVRTLNILLAQKDGKLSPKQRHWMHALLDRDGKKFPVD